MRLLVARGMEGQQVAVLMQRLTEPGDVAVSEDPEAASEEARALAVALDLLCGKEADQRLGDRQPRHASRHSPPRLICARAITSCS